MLSFMSLVKNKVTVEPIEKAFMTPTVLSCGRTRASLALREFITRTLLEEQGRVKCLNDLQGASRWVRVQSCHLPTLCNSQPAVPFQLDDRLLLHFSWHTFPVVALVARQNWKIVHLKWTIEKIVENRRNREKGKFRNACGTPRPKGGGRSPWERSGVATQSKRRQQGGLRTPPGNDPEWWFRIGFDTLTTIPFLSDVCKQRCEVIEKCDVYEGNWKPTKSRQMASDTFGDLRLRGGWVRPLEWANYTLPLSPIAVSLC